MSQTCNGGVCCKNVGTGCHRGVDEPGGRVDLNYGNHILDTWYANFVLFYNLYSRADESRVEVASSQERLARGQIN